MNSTMLVTQSFKPEGGRKRGKGDLRGDRERTCHGSGARVRLAWQLVWDVRRAKDAPNTARNPLEHLVTRHLPHLRESMLSNSSLPMLVCPLPPPETPPRPLPSAAAFRGKCGDDVPFMVDKCVPVTAAAATAATAAAAASLVAVRISDIPPPPPSAELGTPEDATIVPLLLAAVLLEDEAKAFRAGGRE